MSLIKKAHSLLLQARKETNPRKASLLRKASATTYNQMIAFSFIYGVVTEDSDPSNTTQAMSLGTTFTDGVAKLISQHLGLSGMRSVFSAQRLAREFFNPEELGSQRFYEKMIKDFTMTLKNKDKAEDAVHNILAGLNPVTESEFGRAEARNQFAYAGKEHKNLPLLLKNTAKQLKLTGDVIIENKYKDCVGAILSTISLINNRLKYNTRSSQPSTSLEGLVEDQNMGAIPSDSSSTDELVLSNLSQANIENLINLFQKGYGWKVSKSNSQRRAIAHYFFCMMVYFEKSELESLVSNDEEEELLQLLAYNPKDVLDDGRVERDNKMMSSFNKLIEMISTYDTDFLDELTYIYNDINPFDPITKTTGQRAFGTGWLTFLEEIGKDIQAHETGSSLLIPSAESAIENTSHIFKQGSQKRKASLEVRVASLLRRYYQI